MLLNTLWQKFVQSPHRDPIRKVALWVSLPALVLLITVGLFYNHYARAIDAQLQGGAFRSSVNVYGSQWTLTEGDALTKSDIEADLRLTGYELSGSGKPGTFSESSKGFDIHVRPPVRIVLGGKGEIARIESDGRDVKSWTAGYPLLENLSPGREKRLMVTFQELPKVLVDAVVSVEDRHFFHHQGIDLPRIGKAAYVDLRDGRKEQGASTLTMQLVRGLWLDPEKTWDRKISEALMTVHLERQWSKEEIFAAYANQVFLGRESAYSVRGFAEASQLFFGKPIGELTLAEAALLAGMVQRPSYFNPYRNPDRAQARRDVVLNLMLENKFITGAQYEAATKAPVALMNPSGRNGSLGASYFLDMVRNELPEGAKSVYTTVDVELQRAAEEAVESGMSGVDKLLANRYKKGGPRAEVALIALDPHTGEVKALIGGRDYARSQLNRIFAKRPPGSVFKPFVYGAALNTGIEGGDTVLTAATMVDDAATDFGSGRDIYRPANFRKEAFGTLTFQQALAKSDNVAAVKVGEMVGFRNVVALARRAGLNDDIQPTPSVALGSYGVTPFEMSGAYTVFANGGTWVKPRIISEVRNADDAAIRHEDIETHRALDPRVAYLMTSMLQEVMRSGTATGARGLGFTLPAAGKTGTSHDGWFAGYTSQLLCIVWVGFDDYRQLDLEGAKSALPIWTEFMKKAGRLGAFRNAREFPRPGGIESAKICQESGKLAGDLCTRTATVSFIAGTQPKDQCDLHYW